jgi:hypothetical protein
MVLAEEIGSSNTALTAFATGATLDGGITAANRRLHFISMHGSDPSNWTSSMDTLVERSLDWAAGCGAGGGGGTNNYPVLNSIGNKSVEEEQLLQFTILATDTDTGDTLTYSSPDLPSGATLDANTGEFSWTPTALDVGSHNVTFTVTDDGTPQGSDFEGITITVTPAGTPAPNLDDYSCNMKISIDNTKVSGSTAFTDFPVLISLTDDSLKDTGCGFVTSSTGDDIIFVDSSKTILLDHEIEKYDNTTGEVNAWVRIPSLSATSNTDIYMYFGNSNVTTPQENPTGVWDANYKGVWHLKEDAATVPPTSGSWRVSNDADDSEEYISSGSLDWGSSDLELGEEGSAQIVGMRWRNITIPQGVTITSAYIEFTADENQAGTPVNLTFRGEAADNAAVFENAVDNISDRTPTSASVSWNDVPAWSTDETHQSTDISPIIQEIVNLPGWASGNALVVLVTGSGRRTAESHDGDRPLMAPLLYVEYTTTTDLHLDSTSNDNDGIPNGNTLTASGKIDGAQDFDGNDYVESPDSASLDLTSQVTLSAWIRPTSTGSYDRIVGKSHSSAAAPWTMYGLLFDNANHLRGEISESLTQNAVDGTTVVPLNTWTYATVTYDGSNIRVYFNGSEDATPTALSGSIDTNNVPLSIGRSNYNSDYFNGRIDEVRVSNVARSADWIKTSYNNQNSPSTFYSVVNNCPDTTPPIAEFSCSIPLTIDSSKVSGTSDLTDFPVLITLTNTSLKNTANCGYVQNGNGYDIIFSDSTQTIQLDHEIEKYDSAAGELVAWVKVPTLSVTVDTVINLHFGHSSVCGPLENPTGVWDSNYAAVWHLAEDPSGAAPQGLDSTSNDNDGTSNGSMTTADLVDGKIGKGIDFDGTNDWIEMPNSTSLDITGNQITLSAWVKMNASQTVDAGIINKSYSNNYNYMLNVQSSDVGDVRVKRPMVLPLWNL